MTFSINKRPDWEKSMSFANQFEDELLQLFHARTHQLKSYMWPTVGAAPQLTQKRVRKGIESLQSLAVADYLRSKEQFETAGHVILKLLHKAADAAEANSRRSLETAQELSTQLQAAHNRIAELEAEVQFYREKSERAEEWLRKISTEIEDRLINEPEERRRQSSWL
jgi:hypothetical protein